MASWKADTIFPPASDNPPSCEEASLAGCLVRLLLFSLILLYAELAIGHPLRLNLTGRLRGIGLQRDIDAGTVAILLLLHDSEQDFRDAARYPLSVVTIVFEPPFA